MGLCCHTIDTSLWKVKIYSYIGHATTEASASVYKARRIAYQLSQTRRSSQSSYGSLSMMKGIRPCALTRDRTHGFR